MEKEVILAGDWNNLTDEERYELELKFAESYEWNVAHGLYDDYPDENSPEEIAWVEYKIDEARFTYEATTFYRKYLEYKGDKKPSHELLSIFKYNTGLLYFFLNRIKDKKGNEITREFQAIMELQKGKPQQLVDDGRKLEPLRNALLKLDFDTKSKQTWFDGFCNKTKPRRLKCVREIMEEYKVFIERNQ